jgi:CDP-paratose 2-epimerase
MALKKDCPKVLITGGAGLVGTECCKLFASEEYDVISVDNYMRKTLFGEGGDTKRNLQILDNFDNISHIEADIRDTDVMKELLRDVDVVIHAASQPSHPKSIEIPLEDFSINAYGTLNLLELCRQIRPEAVFIFCSSNKVYGENPNTLPIIEKPTRYDFRDIDGIDESLSLDQTMHTPFGVSKVAADLYAQEYAKLYGLKTGVFRMGCITGGAAQAVELHNWEPFFMMKNLKGEVLNVCGFKGKQVRDVIHAKDLALLFKLFAENPKAGEVYNIGGGRQNSISLLESFDLIESITGKKMNYKLCPPRKGDHIVYISDLSKAKSHYDWDISIDLHEIFEDIYKALIAVL